MTVAIGVVCLLLAAYFLEYDTPLGDAAGVPFGLLGAACIASAVLT